MTDSTTTSATSDTNPPARTTRASSDEKRRTAILFFEQVWNAKRDGTIDEVFHPSFTGHGEGVEVSGLGPYKEARATMLSAFPDLRLTVEDTAADGDHVVLRWNARGTHDGPGFGLEPTHRRVKFRGMTWLTFSGNRVIEGWDAWNQGALFQSLRTP